jgi:hypothetical protein
MKTYRPELQALREMGITPLTGEADAYSFRCLCDLDEHGVELIKGILGFTVELTASPWNGGNASILLPYAWVTQLILYHILAQDHIAFSIPAGETPYAHEALITECETQAEADEYTERCNKLQFKYQTFRNWSALYGQPNKNGRNVHAWSGRTI